MGQSGMPLLSPHRISKRARWIAVLVSGGALAVLYRRLDGNAIQQAFRQFQGLWFAGAFLAFLISLSLSAFRWHLMLRLTGSARTFRTTWRFALIGHCFSSLFFGAAVSDVAKASLYSRWLSFPAPRILAASALDRATGVLSTGIYAAVTVSCALYTFHGVQWERLEWTSAGRVIGILLTVAAIGAFTLWMLRDRWSGSLQHFLLEAKKAFRELRAQPRISVTAVACGLAIQIMVSAILGFSLRAVCPTPLPWIQILWTFPLIGLVAALPVTISGAGAREGAAMLLWTSFGISQPIAFSASLLTFLVNLTWALLGLFVTWLSFRHYEKRVTNAPQK